MLFLEICGRESLRIYNIGGGRGVREWCEQDNLDENTVDVQGRDQDCTYLQYIATYNTYLPTTSIYLQSLTKLFARTKRSAVAPPPPFFLCCMLNEMLKVLCGTYCSGFIIIMGTTLKPGNEGNHLGDYDFHTIYELNTSVVPTLFVSAWL